VLHDPSDVQMEKRVAQNETKDSGQRVEVPWLGLSGLGDGKPERNMPHASSNPTHLP
jgi:hypothetical protein